MPETVRKNFSGNPYERLLITGRSFEKVKEQLSLDIEKVPEDAKVLVVGEGFSEYASELKRKRSDLYVIAADPLYAIAKPSDDTEQIKEKLASAGYSPNIVETWYGKGGAVEKKDGPSYMSADVYRLPLRDDSVGQIHLNHVLEHIDFGKALPELLRVLKDGGEVRFGGVAFTIKITENKNKMYLGKLTRDRYNPSGAVLEGPEKESLEKGFQILAGERTEVLLYGYTSEGKYIETFVLKKGKDDVPVFVDKEKDGKVFCMRPNTLESGEFPTVDIKIVGKV